MASRVMRWLYRQFGGRYPLAFLIVELQSALFIVAGTLGLMSFYWDGDPGEFLLLLGVALALTECSIIAGIVRAVPRVRPLRRWIDGARDPESTRRAWSAAVALPLQLVKRDLPVPVLLTVLPLCVLGVVVLDLSWLSLVPLLAGSAIAVGYSAMLHYLAVEAGMRPVLIDINSQLTPRTASNVAAIPLRWRLMIALPLINLITGLVVAALTSDGGGGSNLGVDVMIVVAVATTISLELTVMLSKSILRPVNDLERAVDAIRAGDYNVSVPVTTADELGDLAASFNDMVEGLRERERIREAFGTYLDREVAEYILSDGFTEEGVDVEVSVLFTDVRDFTRFAADATPAEVVAALNRLFEVIVPIIARHGGHVDKFEGDGLLAVFGAPEPFPDHADRAVRAACEIESAVNERAEAGELRVGIGVNTGTVVAGAIGGAGRLNFSVIGSAVNIAARVEAATREVEDSILITTETWKRLSSEFEAESRGKIELKGLDEPETLYAPRLVGKAQAPVPPEPAGRDGDGQRGPARLRRLRPRIRR
jgi:adenylate cyclase